MPSQTPFCRTILLDTTIEYASCAHLVSIRDAGGKERWLARKNTFCSSNMQIVWLLNAVIFPQFM